MLQGTGPDAFKPHFINTASFRVGGQVGWDVSFSKMWFNGDISNAYVTKMSGKGYDFDANIGIVAGWGPGGSAFVSEDENRITWYGISGSFGWGLGASMGIDNTYITPIKPLW